MIKLVNYLLKRLFFFLPGSAADLLRFETVSLLGRLFVPPLTLDTATPKYMNLGCGPRILDGFVNIDFFTAPRINYGADLRYPLGICDNAFEGIFSEHTFEHLTYAEAGRLMRECHRILKPGGVLRVAVPDLAIFINSYCSENRGWFDSWEKLMFTDSVDPERAKRRLATPMEAISFVTQEYGHVSCWDFDTLCHHLKQSGFGEIRRRQFQEGSCPELLVDLDSEDRKFVSVYVEAVK